VGLNEGGRRKEEKREDGLLKKGTDDYFLSTLLGGGGEGIPGPMLFPSGGGEEPFSLKRRRGKKRGERRGKVRGKKGGVKPSSFPDLCAGKKEKRICAYLIPRLLLRSRRKGGEWGDRSSQDLRRGEREREGGEGECAGFPALCAAARGKKRREKIERLLQDVRVEIRELQRQWGGVLCKYRKRGWVMVMRSKGTEPLLIYYPWMVKKKKRIYHFLPPLSS